MNKEVSSDFKDLIKLSDRKINNLLVKSLENTALKSDKQLKIKAELYRKSGQLSEALVIYNQINNYQLKVNTLPERLLPFEINQSSNGFRSAPIVIGDGFLKADVVEQLLKHTLVNKEQFKKINKHCSKPEYEENIRNTWVLFELGKFKCIFTDYLRENIDVLCEALTIPKFDIKRIEIKITNHTDGGFFKTHADNTSIFGETERVISWLYYFHQRPKKFDGGELYVFDSNIKNNTYKKHLFTKINPEYNRLIAFPSCYHHAVAPTQVCSGKFEDGRLAVSGHIRF